ncbi:MAG: hypothetical protein IBX62_02845 [Coriobacteriia bacterium]|nr:hypothetical protein [Coriobacteriia bacterium]
MRGTKGAWRGEAGMTLIEILFATVVLFIAVSGVLTLMATSTRMGVQSKQNVITVNQVQAYVERVRRLPYDDIGVVGGAGGSIPGTLPVETTVADSGYSVIITPTVTWVDDPNIAGTTDYKRLHISASSRPVGGGQSFAFETETFIRPGGGAGDKLPPIVEFAPGSPASTDVIDEHGAWIYGDARTEMPNAVLHHVTFMCDGRELRDSSGGSAYWTVMEPSVTGLSFFFDPWAQEELQDGTTRRIWQDGVRTFRIEAWDNMSQRGYVQRQILLDTGPPAVATTPTAEPMRSDLVRVSWPIAYKGSDPAASYDVITQQLTGADGESPSLEGLPSTRVGTTYFDHITPAFSRHIAWVRSVGPAPMERESTSFSPPVVYVSKPELRGTWRNVYEGNGANRVCNTTISLNLSEPAFLYGSISSTLYRSTSPRMTGAVEVVSGSGFSYSYTFFTAVGNKGDPTPYYHQVRTVVRPLGYPDDAANEPVTLFSNVLGPNGPAETGTLATAGW